MTLRSMKQNEGTDGPKATDSEKQINKHAKKKKNRKEKHKVTFTLPNQ